MKSCFSYALFFCCECRNCDKDNVVVCDSYRRKNIYGEEKVNAGVEQRY